MASTPQPAPAGETAPRGMSELGRLTGVLIDPKPAFADIAARPRWWAPILVIILIGTINSLAFSRRIGWERMMRQQIESNSRTAEMPPEQRERVIQMQVKFASVAGYVGPLIAVPAMTAITAAVLLLIMNLMGGGLTFRTAFAVTAYSWMVGVISGLCALGVMFLKNPEDFDIRNPLAFNVGAFLDPASTPKFLHSVATSLDVFSFWTMALLAVGFSTASRRISFGKAFAGVLIPWAIYVAGKAGFASIFG